MKSRWISDFGARFDWRGGITGAEIIPELPFIEVGRTEIVFNVGTRKADKVGLLEERREHSPTIEAAGCHPLRCHVGDRPESQPHTEHGNREQGNGEQEHGT